MADSEDKKGTTKPPKVVKFVPKGGAKKSKKKPPAPEPPTYETIADEYVQSSDDELNKLTMAGLAKKWGVSRATLYRRKTKEKWDERREKFKQLLEDRKRSLLENDPPPETKETRRTETPTAQENEARRQARVDDHAADKKAQAEIVLHEIAYAMTGHLAEAMQRDVVAAMKKPKSLTELFRSSKNVAEFWEKVVGRPEPPPKQLEVFDVKIQERGGAISTIERNEGESLQDALARVDREAEEAKERIVNSVMEPVSGGN
jgi:hypothetical protein